MSLKDDLVDDESIFFDEDDFAESINFTTVKNRVTFENQLAIFNENNTGLIMSGGLESNKSEATISIPRSLYDLIIQADTNLYGCRILRKKDSKEWEVQREITKDELMADLLCLRSAFNKGKAQ